MDQPNPDFRATITGERITLVAWHSNLWQPMGPAGEHFRRARRSVIADLTILRNAAGEPGELIVDVLAGTVEGAVCERLVEWARALGYARLWLPDAVIDVGDDPAMVGGLAETRCPTCRYRCADEHPDFWAMVRNWGHFPMACPMCGGDLPQWKVRSTRIQGDTHEHSGRDQAHQ